MTNTQHIPNQAHHEEQKKQDPRTRAVELEHQIAEMKEANDALEDALMSLNDAHSDAVSAMEKLDSVSEGMSIWEEADQCEDAIQALRCHMEELASEIEEKEEELEQLAIPARIKELGFDIIAGTMYRRTGRNAQLVISWNTGDHDAAPTHPEDMVVLTWNFGPYQAGNMTMRLNVALEYLEAKTC